MLPTFFFNQQAHLPRLDSLEIRWNECFSFQFTLKFGFFLQSPYQSLAPKYLDVPRILVSQQQTSQTASWRSSATRCWDSTSTVGRHLLDLLHRVQRARGPKNVFSRCHRLDTEIASPVFRQAGSRRQQRAKKWAGRLLIVANEYKCKVNIFYL